MSEYGKSLILACILGPVFLGLAIAFGWKGWVLGILLALLWSQSLPEKQGAES